MYACLFQFSDAQWKELYKLEILAYAIPIVWLVDSSVWGEEEGCRPMSKASQSGTFSI